MTITAVDPLSVTIPLLVVATASLAVALWQSFTTRRDWTLAIPILSLVFSLLSLFVFQRDLNVAPTDTYVRLLDVPRLQEDNIVFGHAGQSRSLFSLFAEPERDSRRPLPLGFASRVSDMHPMVIIRDADDRSRLGWISLILLCFFASATFASTLLHVAPGPLFDTLRRSLFLEQALAPIGAAQGGSRQLGPSRGVPSHFREKVAVHDDASKGRRDQHQQSMSRLKELEVELARSEGSLRPLTESEIAEIKRPLYDRFSTS